MLQTYRSNTILQCQLQVIKKVGFVIVQAKKLNHIQFHCIFLTVTSTPFAFQPCLICFIKVNLMGSIKFPRFIQYPHKLVALDSVITWLSFSQHQIYLNAAFLLQSTLVSQTQNIEIEKTRKKRQKRLNKEENRGPGPGYFFLCISSIISK